MQVQLKVDPSWPEDPVMATNAACSLLQEALTELGGDWEVETLRQGVGVRAEQRYTTFGVAIDLFRPTGRSQWELWVSVFRILGHSPWFSVGQYLVYAVGGLLFGLWMIPLGVVSAVGSGVVFAVMLRMVFSTVFLMLPGWQQEAQKVLIRVVHAVSGRF